MITEALNFIFGEIWVLRNCTKSSISKFRAWKMSKYGNFWNSCNPKNWFHVKSECRKIPKFTYWLTGFSIIIFANSFNTIWNDINRTTSRALILSGTTSKGSAPSEMTSRALIPSWTTFTLSICLILIKSYYNNEIYVM